MKALQKEGIRLKREGFSQAQHVYDKQRKNIDMQEFYEDCLKACSKEIVRIHETNSLSSLESSSSHSYLLELLRKKFIED